MARSLQRELSLALAAAILAGGLAAAAASFFFAYSEAEEFQDDTLRQIAALAGREAGGATYDGSARVADPESRVLIVRLAADPRPAWLPEGLAPGLHTLSGGGETWRVYVRAAEGAGRIAVAQSTDVRDELALDSALRTLIPLLLLLPLLAWLAAYIVRRELAPVRRLADIVKAQPAERPAALSASGVPEEIAPFLRAINELLERVAELLGEQRRFVADAAHELRTPLQALSLQAQNLENAATVEAMRARVAPLRAGIERARRLTDQLLTLARAQAAGAATQRVDLAAFARELVADCLPLAESRAIDLGIEPSGDAFELAAAPELLQLVLRNAIDNALRYTPSGGEVTLRFFGEGPDAVIEVVDTGPGIPAAERERAFQPFHRLEGVPGEGSGLGLAIARDAASRLGAELSLHERPGGGLVFRYRQRRGTP
ncbi:MAG TPA: ATP-binding protein [Burkholderiales bacterium]|nr:ATP-binding protein [Burkholderiales bacterium]